jgi:hypothetical protein
MWRGRVGFAFAFLLWSRAGFAVEANPRVALGLTRGEGTQACIQGGAIERAVERRLRRRVFARNEPPELHIDVALAREADGAWSARLVLRGRSGAELGARELETQAAHCSALDDALVLVVALLVDSPEARAQASAASEPLAPAPSEATQSTKATPPAPRETRLELPPETYAPREPYRVEVAANIVAAAGVLPGVSFGGEVVLGVRPPHFIELRLRPAALLAQSAQTPTPDRGGRFSLLSVALDACPLADSFGQVQLSGCVGQRVGRMTAAGFGYQRNASSQELYYALGVSAAASFWFGPRVGIRLGLDLEAPLTRDSYFSLGPTGDRLEIFRPSPIVGALTAGIGFSL